MNTFPKPRIVRVSSLSLVAVVVLACGLFAATPGGPGEAPGPGPKEGPGAEAGHARRAPGDPERPLRPDGRPAEGMGPRGGDREGGGDARAMERREIGETLARLRNERKELAASGHDQEAEALERRIDRLEQRRQELNRSGGGGGPRGPGGDRGPGEGRRPEEHVRIAIEHLHAAGWHDVAERLEQRVARPQEAGNRRRQDGGHPNRPEGGFRQDGPGRAAGMDGLRQEMGELHRRLERLERRMREGAREPGN